ncbi:MAG: VOC family protein [Anaerolineales bacterium]
MSATYPAVIPMIAYEDCAAAIAWLEEAFGFRERKEMRYTDKDGAVAHAEMEAGDGLIMLATPTKEYESPLHHREHCEAAAKWSKAPWVIDGVLVHVADIESHYERAKKAGANMLSELQRTENGVLYRVEDLEGHRWMFSQG